MAALPEDPHTTSAAIVRWYESKPQEHRPHMGASLIGHICERYIWLIWRWVMTPEFRGRILRLFSSGQREEPRGIEELRGIGAEVWDTDPATGAQWRVSACQGHFGGSLDGVVKGVPEGPKTPAVLEFKTHSNKSFNDVVKKGVQASKPQHYDQMTVYMGLMDLERALYFAVNKDTDDLYTEWVHFNRERFDQLIERAQRLIDSPQPPYRISTDPEHFECKYCSMWKVCHGGQAGEPNCRTCCHSTPIHDAQWRCAMKGELISDAEQRAGCNVHLMIPGLLPYAEPVDGGENFVVYRHTETGKLFVNGPDGCADQGPVFSSKELHRCPGSLIGEMSTFKDQFPGATVTSGRVFAPKTVGTIMDMESDDLDAIPVKPTTKAQKEAAAKRTRTAKAIMEGKV
jgi:hypothetical protein